MGKVTGNIVVMRTTTGASEDWGTFEFVALPSPADRLMVVRDGAENYATVLAIHHRPCAPGSGEEPVIEIVAKWTGAGPKLR